HWYVWLRGNPIHEAIEVMSRHRGDGAPLVWVFFTERAPPKRQVHFVNNRAIAAMLGWQSRHMTFAMPGPSGEQQSLAVPLKGPNDQPVSIDIERDPDAALTTLRG